jgi:hypothetical protein
MHLQRAAGNRAVAKVITRGTRAQQQKALPHPAGPDGGSLHTRVLLGLQRAAGNSAVTHLVSTLQQADATRTVGNAAMFPLGRIAVAPATGP